MSKKHLKSLIVWLLVVGIAVANFGVLALSEEDAGPSAGNNEAVVETGATSGDPAEGSSGDGEAEAPPASGESDGGGLNGNSENSTATGDGASKTNGNNGNDKPVGNAGKDQEPKPTKEPKPKPTPRPAPTEAEAVRKPVEYRISFILIDEEGEHEYLALKVWDTDFIREPVPPSRPGYVFSHWYDETGDGAPFLFNSHPVGDVYLIALFEEAPEAGPENRDAHGDGPDAAPAGPKGDAKGDGGDGAAGDGETYNGFDTYKAEPQGGEERKAQAQPEEAAAESAPEDAGKDEDGKDEAQKAHIYNKDIGAGEVLEMVKEYYEEKKAAKEDEALTGADALTVLDSEAVLKMVKEFYFVNEPDRVKIEDEDVPQAGPEEGKPEVTVTLTSSPEKYAEYGDNITLIAEATGLDGLSYTANWQYHDGTEWKVAEDSDGGFVYAFEYTEENASWRWRLEIVIHNPAEAEQPVENSDTQVS